MFTMSLAAGQLSIGHRELTHGGAHGIDRLPDTLGVIFRRARSYRRVGWNQLGGLWRAYKSCRKHTDVSCGRDHSAHDVVRAYSYVE